MGLAVVVAGVEPGTLLAQSGAYVALQPTYIGDTTLTALGLVCIRLKRGSAEVGGAGGLT